MPTFGSLSIRNKLMFMFMASGTVTLLLACVSFIVYDQQVFRLSKVKNLITLAEIIGSNSTGALTYKDAASATDVLGALSSKTQVVAAYIYDNQGKVFARYLRRGVNSEGAAPTVREDGSQFAEDRLSLFRRISLNGEPLGTVYIQDDLSEMRERLYRYETMLVIVAFGSLLAGFALVSRMQRFISTPIKNLAQTIRTVSIEKNYSIRAVKDNNDETGQLIDGFNTMLNEIQIRDRVLLEAKDVAESANRAKSEFLANMSHEIRTPLNGVIGMVSLALDTEISDEQRDYLDTARTSADSLLNVITDILDFSKIEARKIELESAPFNLRDCLELALKPLAVQADKKGLELLCEVAPEVSERLRGDSNRLIQILVNLVGNAVKFTRKGEVAIKVQIESASGLGRLIWFTVSDTGVGIAREKLNVIFAPFSQADTSTTREFGGTGLGLSISTQLVEMMGGRIWVESEPGRGSQFHFTISLQLEEETEVRALSRTAMDSLCGVKVLVLDDSCANLRILDAMLQRWGLKPTSVQSGESALVELSNASGEGDPFQLIVTDMRMPAMDGFAFVEQVRQRSNSNASTIMMLTSGSDRGELVRCRSLGLAAYLSKPVRESQLLEALVRVVAGCEETSVILTPGLSSAQIENQAAASLTILVAEDNPVNQKLVQRLLKKRGHRVVTAHNGCEALECLVREDFDLVFMDVQMPQMGGVETTAAIRSSEQGSGHHLPIVALTASAMEGDREKCLSSGMDGYLSKPIKQQELDEILRRYSNRSALQSMTG